MSDFILLSIPCIKSETRLCSILEVIFFCCCGGLPGTVWVGVAAGCLDTPICACSRGERKEGIRGGKKRGGKKKQDVKKEEERGDIGR